MNDPHVEWLRYRLKVIPGHVIFENPPPLVQEYDKFRIQLEDDVLTIEMKAHFASEEAAKQSIENFRLFAKFEAKL